MTTGIRVLWCDGGKCNEIEYYCGLDVDRLDAIPEFSAVSAQWFPGGTPLVYCVDSWCEWPAPDEARLVVVYEPASNPALVEQWGVDGIYWGTNTIILKRGDRVGRCEWVWSGAPDKPERVKWEAFDVGAGCARPRSTYRGSRREAWFRSLILECDDYRCVLTGEAPAQALEAAHLIPAAVGENDVPSNGITLRADLHRLFDAGMFTFSADGRVKVLARELGEGYRALLRWRRLPRATRERVSATLGHSLFQHRRLF